MTGTESSKRIRLGFWMIPLFIGYVIGLGFLQSALYPGPPKPRDLEELTMAGRLATLLIGAAYGRVSSISFRFSISSELHLLLINPGLYIGLAVGFFRGSWIQALYPTAIAAGLCTLFLLVPGGIWGFLPVAPLVFISALYTPLGHALGFRIRRHFDAARSNDNERTWVA